MKTYKTSILILTFFVLMIFNANGIGAQEKSSQDKMSKEFGPVLKLKGNARKEINAIANILSPDSKMKPIDCSARSCLSSKFSIGMTLTKPSAVTATSIAVGSRKWSFRASPNWKTMVIARR